MGLRTYSSKFKLQVGLDALQSNGTDAEVTRIYDIHPVTLSGTLVSLSRLTTGEGWRTGGGNQV
jgi:transposase-like protein